MKNILLKVKNKKKTGSKYNRKIRKKNIISAIIYGKKKQNIMFLLKHDYTYSILEKNKKKIDIKNITFILESKKKTIKSKIKEIQKHPFKNKILHIDFLYI